jgi:hypothetical protein
MVVTVLALVALVAFVASVAVAALPPILKPAAVPVMFVPTKAEGVPKAGETKVGLSDNTTLPVPVEVVTPVPPFATGRVPVTPVDSGRPVTLVITPLEGVPKTGVTNVGDVNVGEADRTVLPVPVEVVTPVPPLATATMPVTFAAVPVVFWFKVGTSAATIARKVGTPAAPLGAAKKLFAVLLAYGFSVSP